MDETDQPLLNEENEQEYSLWSSKTFDDDAWPTATSETQQETETNVLRLLESTLQDTVLSQATLNRADHVKYLLGGLGSLTHHFTSLDASKPWFMYWILHGLDLMNVRLQASDLDRVLSTLKRYQHPDGGFGGGYLHMPHLAPTYAAINTIAILASEAAYQIVDRPKLYAFLMKMKQPDGSFVMHEGGEVDVRGSYCALSAARMMNILTPELAQGCGEFVARCQSYEGGIGAVPGVEAHGGYTFCSLAASCILGTMHLLDLKGLTRWAVCRQMHMEGGFQGRTNKLVDSCYAFWQSGSFPILESYWARQNEARVVSLFGRDAMQKWVIVFGQGAKGGLRDKPGKNPDYYHSCYALSGLSISQHLYRFSSDTPGGFDICNDRGDVQPVFGVPNNRLLPTHPIHNVRFDKAVAIIKYFEGLPNI
ncbi:protein farnesyltransferase [Synchytrium microbalum]|uniref:Protein farnesyltransferase subunit beta n=1 Tax=Synchytrium microbalum TaxID=1806994 RepID=A0A507C3R8_9FUNG|nr:protein farnesyltransferase [Synchytrium microbalum]TPX33719.1 protein farnesyltransferase [Synchytrium microbalum]